VIKVKYNQEDHSGLASLPDLPLANYYSHFQQLVHQHVAVVTVDGQRFVVGGWEYRAGKRKVPASKSLSQVKRRTIWHGEVIVLVLGTRTPYQARPRIKRHLIDRAAAV
jgi:hypothetical protein